MKLVLIPVSSSRGLSLCHACAVVRDPCTRSMLIREMTNFTRAISSCLHSEQGSLLNRALYHSLTNRIFLLTFGTPVNPLGVTSLANRTVIIISEALDQHIANYRAHSFQVTEVFLDTKNGFIALNETYQLRGVKLSYA